MVFTMTGGGAALNYKVLGGAAAPEKPRENTVWVRTNVDIPDHVFSLDVPEMVEGRVWFQTATVSTVAFSVLKGNTVMVYPTAAKQCVDGQWVHTLFQVWQKGAWREPHTYLFSEGDHCTDLTGGWTNVPYNADKLHMYLTGEMEGTRELSTCTRKAVDLTGYRRLTVRTESYIKSFGVRIKDSSGNIAAFAEAAAVGDLPFDISGFDGSYFVELYGSARASGGYNTIEFTVTDVWLS